MSRCKQYHIETSYSESPYYDMSDPSKLNAIIAISLANPCFYGRRLAALLNHAYKNYEKIAVITPGHLYRHCYTYFDPIPDENKRRLALQFEKQYIEKELKPLAPILNKPKFTFKRWSDCIHRPDFKQQISEIREYYHSNKSFKSDIDECSLAYVKKFSDHKEPEKMGTPQIKDYIERLHISCREFLIEELAFFALWAKEGYPLLVYPDYIMPSITFHLHTHNKYPDAPKYLRRVAYAIARLKKVSRKVAT